MEKLKIIIVFIAFSMLNSCIMKPEPEDPETNYIIRNISAHDVKLTVFDAYFDYVWKDTTFIFEPNTEISYTYYEGTIHYPFGGAEDSAYIIFDNLKQLIYRKNDGQARNILNFDSYSGGKVDDYLYQYKYEITDTDYANATPIE